MGEGRGRVASWLWPDGYCWSQEMHYKLVKVWFDFFKCYVLIRFDVNLLYVY